MRKGNLIKMAAPAILSAAMMVSGLPVMAADFTSDTAVETEAQTDEFDAADDTADAFAGDEETPFVDDQAAAEDEFAATAETGYKYVYAGLTWAQYWASEGVYNAANTASNGTKDSHDELDKGGFDTVTRATVNHGLHRGSYQCEAIMYDKNGGSYDLLSMFVGNTKGTIGETSAVLLLLGGIFLVAMKVIDLKISLSYLATFAVFALLFGGHGFDLSYVAAELCGGGMMLGAWFMATDYVTRPITDKGQYVYGVILGLLTGLFRIFGGSAEGVSYAIIFTNLLVPIIERLTLPTAFGIVKRKGGKKS